MLLSKVIYCNRIVFRDRFMMLKQVYIITVSATMTLMLDGLSAMTQLVYWVVTISFSMRRILLDGLIF